MVNHKWSNCKSLLTAVFILLFPASVFLSSVQAQTQPVFSGHIENKEYGVYIYMDFYHSAVTVPGQELFGEVAGYLGQTTDSRKWIVLEAEVTTPVTAQLTIVNDYGSEDLTARSRRHLHPAPDAGQRPEDCRQQEMGETTQAAHLHKTEDSSEIKSNLRVCQNE